jgi:hypothetical protein
VLADVADDYSVTAGEPPEIVDYVRRVQMPVVGEILDVADGAVPL